jgi:hypothetical protein
MPNLGEWPALGIIGKYATHRNSIDDFYIRFSLYLFFEHKKIAFTYLAESRTHRTQKAFDGRRA